MNDYKVSENLGKKRYIRLRHDQDRKLEVLQMILSEELICKYVDLDKSKFVDSDVLDRRIKGVIPIPVLIRLGLDMIIDELSSDLRSGID